jgi:NhaP-type Na+/H+ or K+/H+ antiporter
VGFTVWFLVVGAVLVAMALSSTVLKRLPLTASMFYLAVGGALGPLGLGLLRLDIVDDAPVLERLTEIAVIVSLFTAGLKLRLPLADRRWRPAVALATVAMALTVGAIASLAMLLLSISVGAAILLGAVLAPTDPVLASDVQVEDEHDAEPVRFSLTGEAGLNDGTAFPFVMLGLGLLGHHELGPAGSRWAALDLVWAVGAGLGIGAACGAGVGRLVLYLRRVHREAIGTDEFLALGLIALSYGAALAAGAYGFLAVFAAGLTVRQIERSASAEGSAPPVQGAARTVHEVGDTTEPADMAKAVLMFNEQLERLGEVAMVIAVGILLPTVVTVQPGMVLAAALFLVIRPGAALAALVRSSLSPGQRAYIGWFGVRGIGSLYYLTFALTHGLAGPDARQLADATLVVVAASILVHGVSVTPLMRRYARRHGTQRSVSPA